jgi:hypothetical protein
MSADRYQGGEESEELIIPDDSDGLGWLDESMNNTQKNFLDRIRAVFQTGDIPYVVLEVPSLGQNFERLQKALQKAYAQKYKVASSEVEITDGAELDLRGEPILHQDYTVSEGIYPEGVRPLTKMAVEMVGQPKAHQDGAYLVKIAVPGEEPKYRIVERDEKGRFRVQDKNADIYEAQREYDTKAIESVALRDPKAQKRIHKQLSGVQPKEFLPIIEQELFPDAEKLELMMTNHGLILRATYENTDGKASKELFDIKDFFLSRGVDAKDFWQTMKKRSDSSRQKRLEDSAEHQKNEFETLSTLEKAKRVHTEMGTFVSERIYGQTEEMRAQGIAFDKNAIQAWKNFLNGEKQHAGKKAYLFTKGFLPQLVEFAKDDATEFFRIILKDAEEKLPEEQYSEFAGEIFAKYRYGLLSDGTGIATPNGVIHFKQAA